MVEESITEVLRSMWIMFIGSFIIMSCYLLDYIIGDTPAFIFVIMIYFFIGFFVFILYNPFRRLIEWKRK
jgi:hypothetical protein